MLVYGQERSYHDLNLAYVCSTLRIYLLIKLSGLLYCRSSKLDLSLWDVH